MSVSARAAPSPRLRQPWSPRHPSPLGLPPIGSSPLPPHVAFQSFTAYPVTSERPFHPKGPPDTKIPYSAEVRRPQAGTQRQKPYVVPPPLSLNSPDHPAIQAQHAATAQPLSKPDMLVSPPSPTPSETSSLSLYSGESVHKNFPIEVANQRQQEEEEKPPSLFCGCFNFKAWFGSKTRAKEKRILGPPAPAAAPQMAQVRRRPPPLNM
ncbi:hypothetical protein CVT26_008904 [Gymnopilus dilepis]|uniref:Uncharacterized protein n=1 Tax=Gymnopilus dilepis TaxID=231916 RepID=A0A409YAU0_9AGAR|nr:hypothetical protein CVT26_008904 [Gymnopilus dilepis]